MLMNTSPTLNTYTKPSKSDEKIDLYLASTPTHSTALTSCSEYSDDGKMEERPNTLLDIDYPIFWQEHLFVDESESSATQPIGRQRSRTAEDLTRPLISYDPQELGVVRQRAMTIEELSVDCLLSNDHCLNSSSINNSNSSTISEALERRVCQGGNYCIDANSQFFRSSELDLISHYRGYFDSAAYFLPEDRSERKQLLQQILEERSARVLSKPEKELCFIRNLGINQQRVVEGLYFGSKLQDLRRLGQRSKIGKLERELINAAYDEPDSCSRSDRSEKRISCRSCRPIGCSNKSKRITKRK